MIITKFCTYRIYLIIQIWVVKNSDFTKCIKTYLRKINISLIASQFSWKFDVLIQNSD